MAGKKAQFFIIGAVILGIIILSIAVVWNATIKDKENVARKRFRALCDNYKHEVFEISKYAVASNNKSNEEEYLKDFTLKFLQDTQVSEPNFSLLYIYGNADRVVFFNATNMAWAVHGASFSWNHFPNYSYGTETGTTTWVNISSTKINKSYLIVNDDRFYFLALEEKDGEQFVCE